MKTIRWGIIGCGSVTEFKSGPGFQKAHGSALVAVMRRNRDLAEDYARRHGVPRWYDDAGMLIHDPDVDAVYIATPPSSHKEYVCAAARANKPVYVEKPMGLNHAEGVAMIEACERANVPLFAAFYRRALPRFLKVKSLLDEGLIGEVRSVSVRLYQPPTDDDRKGIPHWRVDPRIAGGGYFVDLGSHMIDLLHFFLGPITSVAGFSSNQQALYEAEDSVSAAFAFATGVQGTGLWCFNTGDRQDSTEIVGSRGSLTYATFLNSPIELRTAEGVDHFAVPNPDHIQQPLIQAIVDELHGVGRSPSTGKTGVMTSRVIDSILRRS